MAKSLRREPYRLKTRIVNEGSSVEVTINPTATRIEVDREVVRVLRDNSLVGKKRCENDQHASMEYAGICYSR